MAAGTGAAVLSGGIIAIWVAFTYRPRCTHINEFSTLCIGPWLPVMVTLTVIGGYAIAFGVYSLVQVYPVSRASSQAIAAGVVMVVLGLFIVAAVSDRSAVAIAPFGFTVGFLLVGFGLILMVVAVVRSRGVVSS